MSAHQTSCSRTEAASTERASAPPLLVQRSCSCGGASSSLAGECEGCRTKRLIGRRARLAPGNSGDVFEQEAERVADFVVRSAGEPSALAPLPFRIQPAAVAAVQREDAQDETELENDVSLDDEAAVDAGGDGLDADGDSESPDLLADETGRPQRHEGVFTSGEHLDVPSGGGRPLDGDVQSWMGQRFGHDFSRVRIHTDAEAAESARRVRAHAYTVGPDIYFNEGRYDPEGVRGRRLLAHELTHVVQQGDSRASRALAQRDPERPQGRRRRRAPDSPGGAGQRRRRVASCDGPCARSKSPKHDGCSGGSPAGPGAAITDLTVHRAAHQVIATWDSGSVDTWECSPSTTSGPKGKIPTPLVRNDRIGVKCDQCHTNRHGDGMGWFSGFRSHGRAVGFHNSQLVGPSHESHGCVRVSCGTARTIHDHSSSGVTTVNVRA